MKVKIIFLFSLLTFTTSFYAFSNDISKNITCQEQDYIALRALYLSTNGDHWNDKTGWPDAAFLNMNPTLPTGIDVSTWFGVTTDSNGCVTRLFFAENNLIGNLPEELGNLANLERLWLEQNQLSGNIPAELGQLTNLTHIILGNNQLAGNIPTELEHLNNLKHLSLNMNQLSGNIPEHLANLNTLEYFGLSNNQLTGNIPVTLGGMTSLLSFNLSYNQLSGNIPVELGNLNSLKSLDISHNQLSGSVPAMPDSLSLLILSHNQLSGCYNSSLASFCEEPVYDFFGNSYISDGNNFDAVWSNFCAAATGACTVDIDNTHQNTFTVYPIPAKDFIVFDVPNIAAADEIILYDITGREISRQAFPQDKRLVVSHLNDGVYIYRIFYAEEVYSGKIVVE